PLRGDHVRPPPENVNRFVALGNGRDRRNRSLAPELRRLSTRLIAHENVQPVELGFEAGDEQRDRASRLREQRLGLGNLAIARDVPGEPEADELEQALVGRDLLASEREARLEAPDEEV